MLNNFRNSRITINNNLKVHLHFNIHCVAVELNPCKNISPHTQKKKTFWWLPIYKSSHSMWYRWQNGGNSRNFWEITEAVLKIAIMEMLSLMRFQHLICCPNRRFVSIFVSVIREERAGTHFFSRAEFVAAKRIVFRMPVKKLSIFLCFVGLPVFEPIVPPKSGESLIPAPR